MPYSLPIRCRGARKSWWANFTKITREEIFGPTLGFATDEWLFQRAMALKKYNAWYDGDHVHFKTEQDATLFLLRWS